jgi:Ni/Co efflux regulator RcnB
MKTLSTARFAVVFLMFALAAPQSFGDKPEWAGKGNGNGKGDEWHDKGKGKGPDRGRDDDRHAERYFTEHHRGVVHEYYGEAFRSGHCPPGLAKKNNGCMPPGQAKKWRIGRPLPREVVYYPVPQDLVIRLGPPPAGEQYVRVAGDILLITVGSKMVLDGLTDLGR